MSWLRRFGEQAAGPPEVVVFPHAGGSAGYYTPVARALGRTFRTHVAQYPARQERLREDAVTSMVGLVDGVLPDVLGLRPGPVVLFGHSMGALLAYETCRRLEQAGQVGRALLIVSGRRSPSLGRPVQVDPHDDASILAELSLLGTELTEFTDEDVAELFLPALRGDYQALAGYRYVADAVPLGCPVRVFHGDADPRVGTEEATAWAQCTSRDVEVRSFPGDHFYFRDRPDELAAAIGDEIGAWWRGGDQ